MIRVIGNSNIFTRTKCYHYQSARQLVRLESTERISTPVSFARRSGGPKKENEKTTAYGWLMLLIPFTTFGLGCWQVQRKRWKEDLVKQLEVQTSKPPIDFPDDIQDLNHMEYQSVRVRGRFLHDHELTVGPRSLISKNNDEPKGGLITRQDSSIGYLVVTPFQVEGTNYTILVNRGWVPRKSVNAGVRLAGQTTGTVELVGVVRAPEQRPQFSPKSSGNTFLYRDIPRMCSLTGADPYFLDVTGESTVPGGPIGGQTRVTLRNEHMSYIVTWFSLSAFTSYLWYRQIYKRIPR